MPQILTYHVEANTTGIMEECLDMIAFAINCFQLVELAQHKSSLGESTFAKRRLQNMNQS